MTTTTKIQLPYLEDTGLNGKKIYTPREWTERFRHCVKRIHNIDIKQILTDDTVPTDGNWDTKEPEIRQDFIWSAGQSAIEIITKGEFNTALECTGKPYLLKAQHCAFNISDSTTIPLIVQNWQITSFVPGSTDFVVDSSNKCLAVRTVGMQRCPGFHKNVSFAK